MNLRNPQRKTEPIVTSMIAWLAFPNENQIIPNWGTFDHLYTGLVHYSHPQCIWIFPRKFGFRIVTVFKCKIIFLFRFLVGEEPASMKDLCLKLLLILCTGLENVSQNTLMEYLMMNSIFESLAYLLSIAGIVRHSYSVEPNMFGIKMVECQ